MIEEEKKIITAQKDAQWMLFVDRMMDTVDIVVSQVTSGRWLLTVAAGVCLIHMAWNAENKEKIIDIIKDIIIFYFVVRDSSKSNGTVTTQSPIQTTNEVKTS